MTEDEKRQIIVTTLEGLLEKVKNPDFEVSLDITPLPRNWDIWNNLPNKWYWFEYKLTLKEKSK